MNKLLFSSLASLPLLIGCASAPEPSVRYVDPGSQGTVQTTGIESQDIAVAAQKAAQSIVNIPQITNAPKPPTIIITPVANRSSSPIDTDLYTTKLRGTLMQYASGKVQFLARDVSYDLNNKEQKLRESGAVAGASKDGTSRVGATYDYVLTADLQGIATASSQGASDYFLVSFKLVDYKDILIWESQYEIKKEGRESGVYR